MRTIRFLFFAFLALCLVAHVVAASERYTAQRRQDEKTSTFPSPEPQGEKTTAQSDETTKSASPTDSASSSKSSQTDSPATTTSRVQATGSPIPTSPNVQTPSATNGLNTSSRILAQADGFFLGTLSTEPNTLPIHPSIRPGLSVAGVILLVSGTVYTLSGIKNKRLHIFLSTAYLTGLSVAVLMVYVMNPPIKNGVQGAYVVAAVLTGLVFGAMSIVFAEVTEGLGCLLGGFCLSMWLLVLKPGGLVTSTGGKIGLIAAFSLTIFALYFSPYTRPYGLIGSISFAGATVVVLGIDCFSRAGLKEFWLYIWDLNNNIFPLNTMTYPHTRGLRIEIAAIVLVFLIGIISQLKLWRVIKERRDYKEEERKQGERNLEALDEDVGRVVEEGNNRERAQWEAIYGDKEPSSKGKKADSAISGLEVNSATSGVETAHNRGPCEEDQIEMIEMETSGPPNSPQIRPRKTQNGKNWPLVTVRVGSDDGQSRRRAEDDAEPDTPKTGQLSARNPLASRHPIVSPKTGSPVIGHDTLQPSIARPPPVVPLPFAIPAAADSDNKDDGSSVATFADSHHEPMRNTKRSSGISLIRRLSTARNSRAMSCDEASLIVPHIEDDRASSIAATVDDLTEDGRSPTDGSHIVVSNKEDGDGGLRDFGLKLDRLFSRSSSGLSPTLPTRPNSIAALPTAQDDKAKKKVHRPYSMTDLRGSRHDSEKKPAANGITSYWFTRTSIELKARSKSAKKIRTLEERTSAGSVQTAKDRSSPKLRDSKSSKSISASVTSGPESLAASLSTQRFPRRVSKVVTSYRTNEWAKHLDAAEKPDLDDLKLADSPEPEEEAPRPVNLDELQQTADNATPPPARTRTASQMSFAASQPASGHSRSKNKSRVSFTDCQQGQPLQSNSFYQQGVASRIISSHSLQRAFSPSRPTSNIPQSAKNIPQPLMLAHRGLRSVSTPLFSQAEVGSPVGERTDPVEHFENPTGTTLLGQRESMVRNKFPFGSSPQLPTSPEPVAALPYDSASTYNYRISMLDDDMTLKDRRDLIQRQAMIQSQEQRPATAFDSHQPIRAESRAQTADKREAMLASWRESVRHDLTQTQQPKIAVDARRADMLNDRRQSLLNQRQQLMETNYRDSVLDERMRRGDMLDLHKEVLRKMQANANKYV